MPIKTERTLLIGLGGTGREILLRIRRSFYLAGCPVQPWVSYLWIDTAARQPAEQQSKLLPRDYVSNTTRFAPNEIYDLGVKAEQAFDIKKNPLAWMNVWEWADPEAIQPALEGQGLENGAKQQPPLGRLAVFFHGPKLIQKLCERLEQLQDNNINAQKDQVPPEWAFDVSADAPLKIVICGSLAGGTGAGCCLDVAAMLKAGGQNLIAPLAPFQRTLQEAKIYGFFALPEAFCNDAEARTWSHFDPSRVRANGYAMLQELENVSLVRGEGGQFLTGRDKIGQIHATWMYPTDLRRAPWVEGPLYHNIFLLDGFGEIDTKLRGVGDTYDLAATTLFYELQGKNKAIEQARSNESYQSSRGHIEMVPPEAVDFRDAKWANVYSFVFGTVGGARITFDAPRLRLNAAYTLAERAVREMLGEAQPEPKATEEERTRSARTLDVLKKNLLRRLEAELTARDQPNGQKWSEVVRAKASFAAEDAVKALTWRPAAGFRMQPVYERLALDKPAFNVAQFAKDLETDLLGNRRLDHLLRDVIDETPLPAAADGELYTKQGGLRAAELLIGALSEAGLIQAKVKEMQASMKRARETDAKKIEDLREGVLAKVATLDKNLATLEEREQDKTWFTGTARTALEGTIKERFDELLRDLKTYAKLKFEAGMFECLERGWDLFIAGPAYTAFARQWQGALAQTRVFLDDLLMRSSDERRADPGCGIVEVLRGLRTDNTSSLTHLLKPEYHRDSAVLMTKIEETYRQHGVKLADHIKLVQKRLLTVWRAEMRKLYEKGKLAREPREFKHIVDLANDECVPRENERFDPASDKLGFSDRLDALYLLVSQETLAGQLLKNNDESVARAMSSGDVDFLRKNSHCRLAVFRKANGEIERRDDLIARDTGDVEPCKEHRHFHAPSGTERLEGFSFEQESDPLEARAFRVEMSIPLPAMQALKAGADSAAGIDQYKLHFFRPKNGYMPIHRFDLAEAQRIGDLYKHAVLSILLGQFRPSKEREGQDDWCFEWLVDQNGRPQPNTFLRSIADVVRYLGRPDNQGFLKAIVERNVWLLRDLGPNVLIALDLILQYNLSWTGKQQLKFSKHKISEIHDRLRAQGADMDDVVFEPPSVQQLILDAIRKDLAAELQRWQVALETDPNKTQDTSVQMTYNVLRHFLQHFATFMPANLRRPGDDGNPHIYAVTLLCLLTEVDQSSHLEADEDLTLREQGRVGQPVNPIAGRLGLRAPWVMYTPELASQTFEQHYFIANERDVSMEPVKRDESVRVPPSKFAQIAKSERLGDGLEWTAEMLYSDAPVRDANLYRKIFKLRTLLGLDPDLCREVMQRRKQLAAGPRATAKVASAPAPAASATAPVSLAGRYVNGRVKLTLAAAGAEYHGVVELNGKSFDLSGREDNGILRGQFKQGASGWAFEAAPKGTTLEFKTGSKVEVLEREREQSGTGNPFEADGPVNPFESGT